MADLYLEHPTLWSLSSSGPRQGMLTTQFNRLYCHSSPHPTRKPLTRTQAENQLAKLLQEDAAPGNYLTCWISDYYYTDVQELSSPPHLLPLKTPSPALLGPLCPLQLQSRREIQVKQVNPRILVGQQAKILQGREGWKLSPTTSDGDAALCLATGWQSSQMWSWAREREKERGRLLHRLDFCLSKGPFPLTLVGLGERVLPLQVFLRLLGLGSPQQQQHQA